MLVRPDGIARDAGCPDLRAFPETNRLGLHGATLPGPSP